MHKKPLSAARLCVIFFGEDGAESVENDLWSGVDSHTMADMRPAFYPLVCSINQTLAVWLFGHSRKPLTIAILSFNRSAYLREVIASLVPQLQADDEVILFQDGGWNRFSQRAAARDEEIEACLAVFDEFFFADRPPPCGAEKFCSAENLGIAGNYRRAEEHVFEVLKRDGALFLEDDLVLGPHYLFSISRLLALAETEPRLGYVAAYGDFWATLDQQYARVAELTPMHENWGAALTRASWLAQKPIREGYWDLVKDCDYVARDHDVIRAFFREQGFNCEITSQDASRWVACCTAKLARVMTAVCQARYIGATGVHFTPEFYERYRFADAQIFPDRPSILPPSRAQLDAWIDEGRKGLREGYVHSYQKANL